VEYRKISTKLLDEIQLEYHVIALFYFLFN
jgi:hypothetical protein